MKGMTKQELKEEDCSEYTFLVLDGLFETAEVITIQAGSEEDAWELLSEDLPSNTSVEFLLTDKMRAELKKVL